MSMTHQFGQQTRRFRLQSECPCCSLYNYKGCYLLEYMVRIRNDLSCYGRARLVFSLLFERQPCNVKQAHTHTHAQYGTLYSYSHIQYFFQKTYKLGYSVIGKYVPKFPETIDQSKDIKHLGPVWQQGLFTIPIRYYNI